MRLVPLSISTQKGYSQAKAKDVHFIISYIPDNKYKNLDIERFYYAIIKSPLF